MAGPRAAFDLLFDLLHQVSDDEIESALEIVRRYGAEVSLPRDSRIRRRAAVNSLRSCVLSP